MTETADSFSDPALTEIIDLLTKLASGSLSARLPVVDGDDQMSIVAGALNMLAEELEASFEQQKAMQEDLEEKVHKRTAELAAKLSTIEAQRDVIEELSVPVLTVGNEVLLLPIVGTVDTRRARHMNERLLGAISAQEASVAILDITGVPVVDTHAANHFIGMIQAANMLGAQVIVTGVNPKNALTLTKLGVDLETLDFQGSLSQGLKRAARIALSLTS